MRRGSLTALYLRWDKGTWVRIGPFRLGRLGSLLGRQRPKNITHWYEIPVLSVWYS